MTDGDQPSGLDDVKAEIQAFQRKTFPDATPASVVEHLRREVMELHELYWKHYEEDRASDRERIKKPDSSDVGEEMADVFILLSAVEDLVGLSIAEVSARKLAKLKQRTWGKPDAQGVVEHVRDEEHEAPSDVPTMAPRVGMAIVLERRGERYPGQVMRVLATNEDRIAIDAISFQRGRWFEPKSVPGPGGPTGGTFWDYP